MPIAIVLILLILLGFAWFYWLKDFWKEGSLKRLLATCVSALVICLCILVLMGFSTQSKLPFGQKIKNISAEQVVAKEQKQVIQQQEERDKELISDLDNAILVANNQKILTKDVAVETITTDWLATYRAKISEISDPEARTSYAERLTDIETYFHTD